MPRGLAGSGVVLDPEKAREDVEPWSRMAGGVVKDALDESGIQVGRPDGDEMDFDVNFGNFTNSARTAF